MNILLVEDDRDSRVQLGRFLRELGHQVLECASGQEALQYITRGFHAVFTDIKMPGISGIELLRKVKAMPGVDVGVVLFTGQGDMDSAIEALRAGAYDYLLKPLNVKELAVITDRLAEDISLRLENKTLTERFNDEVEAATEEVKNELSRLRKAYTRSQRPGEIGVFSAVMMDIFRQARTFHADRSIPVLIEGETGTGKEVLARYIHFGDTEVTTPFVDINCAALNPNVFESEFFGYEAGAFTGGLPKGQRGKMDLAGGGTVFLDEIADLTVDLQAKLLRVIQEKEFYRVGGLRKIKTDVRIICATNVDIEEKVKRGAFRKDLYYRLNVGRLVIPPLRERKEEIVPLAEMFLNEFSRKRGKNFRRISPAASEIMLSYNWPGNVRELRNAMEWATLMHDGPELKQAHLGITAQSRPAKNFTEEARPPVIDPDNFALPNAGFDLEGCINKILCRALEISGGNITRAARYLGISRRSLQCRLARLSRGGHEKGRLL